jgi:hypothetical protein
VKTVVKSNTQSPSTNTGRWKMRLLSVSLKPGLMFTRGAILGSFLLFYLITGTSRVPSQNEVHPEFTCQAESYLSGHFYLTGKFCINTIGERISWHSHWYIVHPPLAGLVMVLGNAVSINEKGVSCLVGAICCLLCWELTQSLWLVVLFGLGTNFWYEASIGRPWGFTSVLGCLPVFLALLARTWGLQGFWMGLACLARYDLVGASVVMFARSRSKFQYFLGFLPSLVFYLINSKEKLGRWFDNSIQIWYQQGGNLNEAHQIISHYGWFSWHYLPWNIYTSLFLGPNFVPQFPWFQPTVVGQSLLTTSPALVLIFRELSKESAWIWLAFIISMSGAMLTWSNGYVQFGSRYWITVLPFLILLISRKPLDALARTLIVASVVFNAYGVWYIRTGYPF